MDGWRTAQRWLLGGVLASGAALFWPTTTRADVATAIGEHVANQVTAWFINPPPPTTTSTNTSPPPDTPPPPPPPPPPPEGGGSPPPDTPPPTPPTDSPEPASIITALLGAGFASLAAWRHRRRKRANDAQV